MAPKDNPDPNPAFGGDQQIHRGFGSFPHFRTLRKGRAACETPRLPCWLPEVGGVNAPWEKADQQGQVSGEEPRPFTSFPGKWVQDAEVPCIRSHDISQD